MTTLLRQLYTPIQPTIRQSADGVIYRELLPQQQLQPYIYCYWTLETTRELKKPFHYQVVADGCVDIFFDLRNPVASFVMGFCKRYTEFALDRTFRYVGIRFLPTMFTQFFGVDASWLSDRYEALNIVVPSAAQYIADNLSDQLTAPQLGTLLDRYFAAQLATVNFNDDSRLYSALELILTKHGIINTETDLDTGISPRQLQRLFNFYIGDTQKTFSQVVRFQYILKAEPANQCLKKNNLFFDAGYYDQAHFIKAFKNFYGNTPGKAASQ